MDNFLLKSILSETKAQIAFSNGWRYGAPIPPGKITLNDLYNIIPMNPPVSMVQLTGRDIWMMLEESLEHLFSRDPYNQMGGYMKRCMGLNLYFKVENPRGHRVQEIFIQGKKLKMDETYQAAYVTSQGVPRHYGTNHELGDVKAIDAMLKYLEDNSSVQSENQGRITAI